MPPLTATPTNTLPDAGGSLRGEGGACCRCGLGLCDGDGLALVCEGDGLAGLCEGDGETGTGGVPGPPAEEEPLVRPSELT